MYVPFYIYIYIIYNIYPRYSTNPDFMYEIEQLEAMVAPQDCKNKEQLTTARDFFKNKFEDKKPKLNKMSWMLAPGLSLMKKVADALSHLEADECNSKSLPVTHAKSQDMVKHISSMFDGVPAERTHIVVAQVCRRYAPIAKEFNMVETSTSDKFKQESEETLNFVKQNFYESERLVLGRMATVFWHVVCQALELVKEDFGKHKAASIAKIEEIFKQPHFQFTIKESLDSESLRFFLCLTDKLPELFKQRSAFCATLLAFAKIVLLGVRGLRHPSPLPDGSCIRRQRRCLVGLVSCRHPSAWCVACGWVTCVAAPLGAWKDSHHF